MAMTLDEKVTSSKVKFDKDKGRKEVDEVFKKFDPEDPKDLGRLRKCMDKSYEDLSVFRLNRVSAIEQYVGYHYSNKGSQKKIPFPMIEMAVSIYSRKLIAKEPQVMVSTWYKSLRHTAESFQIAINFMIKHELKFKEIMDEVVRDALFSMGIVKVGVGSAGVVRIDEEDIAVGQPFIARVSMDNWLHDTHARNWGECGFMGDISRVAIEELMDDSEVSKETKDKLWRMARGATPEDDGRDEDEMAESISKDSRSGAFNDERSFIPQVSVANVYLPRYKSILEMTYEHNTGEAIFLKSRDYEGPSNGPYRILALNPVPDNIMPLPPVASWLDIHEMANEAIRKVHRQSQRQKRILGAHGEGANDVERINKTSDGEAVRIDSPGKFHEYAFGGIDQVQLAFAIQLKSLYSYYAGNLDSLGGLSPMAETATQDKLISEAANERIQDMQSKVVTFVKDVISDVAYYLWTDPMIDLPLVKRVPGFNDVEVNVSFRKDDRQGDFLNYNFDIVPHSLIDQSPTEKLKFILEVMQNVVLPNIQVLHQQGITVDFQQFFSLVSKFANINELLEIVTLFDNPNGIQAYQGPVIPHGMENLPGQSHEGKPGPVNTKRTYERVSRPGAQGDTGIIQSLLNMGGGQGQGPLVG